MLTQMEDNFRYFTGPIVDVREGDYIRCTEANELDGVDPLLYRTVIDRCVTGRGYPSKDGYASLFVKLATWEQIENDDDLEFIEIPFDADVILKVERPFQTDEDNNLIRHWVNVYELDQGYGGPEEGGWWFTTGTAIRSTAFADFDKAMEYCTKVREAGLDDDAAYPLHSVLYSGGRHAVYVEDHPARDFPENTPHYE